MKLHGEGALDVSRQREWEWGALSVRISGVVTAIHHFISGSTIDRAGATAQADQVICPDQYFSQTIIHLHY